MRRLLLAAYFFPPVGGAGVQRPLKLAKSLLQFGWLPTVLTVRDSTYPLVDASLLAEVPPEVTVLRAPAPLERIFADGAAPRGLRFLLNSPDRHWTWSAAALVLAARQVRAGRVDAVLTTSSPPSCHFIGYRLKCRYGLPWVADFRDPWTMNPFYRPLSPLHRRIDGYWERRFLARADRVTITTYDSEHHFPPGAKLPPVITLPNGYDEADFVGMGVQPPAGPPSQIGYVGGLYDDSVTKAFLDGLQAFIAELALPPGAVQLVMAGYFRDGHNLFERRGLQPYTRLCGYLSHRESIAVMAASHILALLTRHGPANPAYDSPIPGKAFEYLRTGRPILHVAPRACHMSREITRLGAGQNAYGAADVTRLLAAAYRQWRRGQLVGRPVTAAGLAPFERTRQAQVLARALDSLVATKEVEHGRHRPLGHFG